MTQLGLCDGHSFTCKATILLCNVCSCPWRSRCRRPTTCRDNSITIVDRTDNSDDDDAPLGSKPSGGDGDNDYEEDGNDGGNDDHDNETGNDGFDNDDSGDYKEDASMEEAEGDVVKFMVSIPLVLPYPWANIDFIYISHSNGSSIICCTL